MTNSDLQGGITLTLYGVCMVIIITASREPLAVITSLVEKGGGQDILWHDGMAFLLLHPSLGATLRSDQIPNNYYAAYYDDWSMV